MLHTTGLFRYVFQKLHIACYATAVRMCICNVAQKSLLLFFVFRSFVRMLVNFNFQYFSW